MKKIFFIVFVLLISQEGALMAHTNALIHEDSPYLQQHAHNPVNWMPWGEAAFTKAQKEHKLIFLSIGYSTCHWCHVMEHESFENAKLAQYLNAHFVAIKVDREEMPQIDRYYQNVYQLMNRRGGGWPLTIIMTPDRKPFFSGTYIPIEAARPDCGMCCGRSSLCSKKNRISSKQSGETSSVGWSRWSRPAAPGKKFASTAK